MTDRAANATRELNEKTDPIRELNAEETTLVGGGLGAKQDMPYTPPAQDPFDPLPKGHSTHTIHY
jgi:hypothetical protein